jgi:ParB/RepB/Spo0J family partition protein
MQRIDDRRIRQTLRRVVPQESAQAMLQVILPDRLTHNPWTAPVGLDAESMDQFTEVIITRGLREPLLARRLPDNRYQVLIGGRTLEAARRIGLRTLPVIVAHLSEKTAMAIALADALTRERISPWEMAEGLAEFRETLGELGQPMSPDRVAVLLDHSSEWVERMQFIAERLPPAVLEQAGVSVHDMHVLSEDSLLRAAEPANIDERARRLRELHANTK